MRNRIGRLGWPENRVRVKVAFLGGGCGAKLYIKLEALLTALSMIAKRPVKVALPFEEMFYGDAGEAPRLKISPMEKIPAVFDVFDAA